MWNMLYSWPTIQNQIILLIAIIVPTQTTYFLFICFFQVQLQNKSKEETQSSKGFSPHQQHITKCFTIGEQSSRNAHYQFVAVSFSITTCHKTHLQTG